MKKLFLILLAFSFIFITSCVDPNNPMRGQSPDTNFPSDQKIIEPSPSPMQVVQGTGYENKKLSWGFKKKKDTQPEVPDERKDILKRFDGYYLGDTSKKVMYLTFDEGYENGYTGKILDVLQSTGVPAAFFVTGGYLQRETALIKRMVNEGHIVGNHTLNHPSMPAVTDDEKLKKELTNLDEKFFALTQTNMKFIRPPMGEFSERTLALSKNLGYKTIFWSSAYVDWNINPPKCADFAFEQVTNQFHNGCIILLHAISKENLEALPEIIKDAREKGYEFGSLNEL